MKAANSTIAIGVVCIGETDHVTGRGGGRGRTDATDEGFGETRGDSYIVQQQRRRRPALSHTKSGRSVAAAAASVASVPVGGRGRSVGRWGPQFVRLGCTAPFARSLKTELLEDLATGLVMTNVWIKPV